MKDEGYIGREQRGRREGNERCGSSILLCSLSRTVMLHNVQIDRLLQL